MKVMTYNIRYATEEDGENSWSKRKDFLTEQIKFYEPDILGVQEALLKQLEHLEKNTGIYDYLGTGRDGGEDAGEFTAIFYKGDKYRVLEKNTFWLSETPEKISKGWDAKFPRVCTYALFEDKRSDQKFWVFNTHFDHKGEESRTESARLILKKIKEINTEDNPVILLGDFNLEPNSKSIRILSEAMNDSKKISTKVNFGPEGTFNEFEFQKPVKKRIDYIFTSKNNIEVIKYAVLSDSEELTYPSDHFPVVVELNFTNN